MQNVKDRALVRMLNCLDRKQLKGFADYLACPLFNTNSSLEALFECLEKRALNRKIKVLSASQLLEGSGISLGLLDKLCSKLLVLLNRFVALWAEQTEEQTSFVSTFQAWMTMGLEPDLLEREYRKMKRKLDKSQPTEFDALYNLQLEHLHAQYLAGQPRKKHLPIYAPLQEQLEAFYYTHLFKYRCAQASAGEMFAQEKTSHSGGSSMPLELSGNLSVLGQAYSRALQIIQNPQPSLVEIQDFTAYLDQVSSQISRIDRTDLYGYLLNACIKQLSTGIPGFDLQVSATYDAMLAQKLLPVGTFFNGGHFKNIVAIKVRIGAVTEANGFIETYQDKLSPDEKLILLPYTKGLVHFFSHNFREAIAIFRRIVEENPEDLFWGFEARNMLWKSYYAAHHLLSMEEHEEMLQLYHSFRVFVARNKKLVPRIKAAYQQFIRVFNRLIRTKDKALWNSKAEHRKELEDIYNMTQEAEHLIHRQWILDSVKDQLKVLENGL